jgi:hypothetical protein
VQIHFFRSAAGFLGIVDNRTDIGREYQQTPDAVAFDPWCISMEPEKGFETRRRPQFL